MRGAKDAADVAGVGVGAGVVRGARAGGIGVVGPEVVDAEVVDMEVVGAGEGRFGRGVHLVVPREVEREERAEDLGIELRARDAAHLGEDLGARARGAVDAVRAHRVEGVGDRDDPGEERDVAAGEAVRVATAVEALVVVAHAVEDGRELRYRGGDGSGKGNVEVAALTKALIAAGIDYCGIDVHDSSLEDIFVDLVSAHQEAAA